MSRFYASVALVALLLPAVALSLKLPGLGLGVGLGVGLGPVNLGLNLSLHIPPIELGTSVDLLIDLSTALQILATPYDPEHGIAGCDVQGPPGAGKSAAVRNGLNTAGSRWYKANDGTWYMAVVIDPSFTQSQKDVIMAGMLDIERKSCMKFYVYNESDLIKAKSDYVRIERSNTGCWSHIGRQGTGKQIVNLATPACDTCSHCIWAGTVAHELLHAIGFDHQQNTPGRDQYVYIQTGNILKGQEHNFKEADSSKYTSFGAPYDYESVMHYDKSAFSANGQDTIVVRNGATIGQRNGLSYWDGYKVKKMHGCPA